MIWNRYFIQTLVLYLLINIARRSLWKRHSLSLLVGNKAKGQIWKRLFQENKGRQIFRKSNISYPLIPVRTSEIRHFDLVSTYYNNEHALRKMIETCIA